MGTVAAGNGSGAHPRGIGPPVTGTAARTGTADGPQVEAPTATRTTTEATPRTRPLRKLLPWALAALTVVLAGSLPLAPVVADTPAVEWPLDPGAPEPTTALFMPYRPIDVTAQLPCATTRALAAAQAE